MGITYNDLTFLRYCKENSIDFESTCQIGRQNCFFSLKTADVEFSDYAEPLFRFFGSKRVESVDYSDYENASIIHDMNLPITENLKNKYSVVIDSGTLEHVFNYPVAIKNCMQMVATGGHLLIITPANNWFGHGFYQFSPELFFSLLSEQNGFTETQVFIQDDINTWYKVRSPKEIKRRTSICCARNTQCQIYVASKKISLIPEKLTVLQSDYVNMWEDRITTRDKQITPQSKGTRIIQLAKKIIPGFILNRYIKSILRFILRFIQNRPRRKWERMEKAQLYEKVDFSNYTQG